MISDSLIHHLLECGNRAPSADNCQPWRFAYVGNQLQVFIQRTGAFYDVDCLPSSFAIGSVLENIRIAASHAGYMLLVSPFPQGEASDLVATVSLDQARGVPPDPLYPFVTERCTNRKPYSRRELPAGAQTELQAVPGGGSGFRFVLVTDRRTVRRTASLVMKADWIRFEHEQIHQEFHGKLRFTREEKERTGDGLSLDTLELGPLGGPFLRFHRPWERTARLNCWGLSKLMALQTYLLGIRAGGVGLLLGPARDARSFVRAGEIFQRVWLTATRHGLALQPLAAIPLFLLRLERRAGHGFEERQVRLLTSLKGALADAFQLSPHEAVLMMFRLGYAAPPTARSARRPVEKQFCSAAEGTDFGARCSPAGGRP